MLDMKDFNFVNVSIMYKTVFVWPVQFINKGLYVFAEAS